MSEWTCVLELDACQSIVSGSSSAFRQAIERGADLRAASVFQFNEHIDTTSDNSELVYEQMDFRVTYLLDKQWAAGIETMRMPVQLPTGFGPDASISFFLYNENGLQAVARPYLNGSQLTGLANSVSSEASDSYESMSKYHSLSHADDNTNAPSRNFIYDFESLRFLVRDTWEEVLSHDSEGHVVLGSIDHLAELSRQGREIKVAIRGLCDDLVPSHETPINHEVYVHIGPCYFHTKQKLFIGAANPLVRVKPAIPLQYHSKGWDFGWLLPRTDGCVARWLCDPYTLKFHKSEGRYAIRWFASR